MSDIISMDILIIIKSQYAMTWHTRKSHLKISIIAAFEQTTLIFIYIGVCEPMNSTICVGKNTWVDCSSEAFECEALKADPGMCYPPPPSRMDSILIFTNSANYWHVNAIYMGK
jgi:hypothetical protein